MKILITAPYSATALEEVSKTVGQVIYKPWNKHGKAFSEAELIAMLKESGADALVIENDDVTEKIIESFPALNFIGVCRGTPSNVALSAATRAGIPVFFTPARNAQAVAEMFIANIIVFLRNTVASINWLKQGQWIEGTHTPYLRFKGNELAGKTVGMVGFGAIAQRIAEMLKSFPCFILYYDPYVELADTAYLSTTIEDIFERSDIVAIHLPSNSDTKGMIGSSLIAKMKSDAIFVNTARALVVNRADLLHALQTNKIRGAILDVFDHEPPDAIDDKLINLPNVLATPHTGGATIEVEDHHAAIMNEAIKDWFVDKNRSGRLLANSEILS